MPTSRIAFIALLLLTLCAPILPPTDSTLWEETLSRAEADGVPYEHWVHAAREGDSASLQQLLRFSRRVDAASGLGHGVALMSIMNRIGDAAFANAVLTRPDEERPLLGILLLAGVDYGLARESQDRLEDVFPKTFALTRRAASK